ncbi:MAG: PAS domain S-box protein [Verrucomicrobiota bacterium]
MTDLNWVTTVLHSMMKAVIVTDGETLIHFMNPAAERITGFDLDEVRGKPAQEILKLIDENSQKPIDNFIQRTIHEAHVEHADLILINHDGLRIPIEAEGVVLRTEDQAFSGVLITLIDLTQRRKMEDALRRSKEWFRSLVEEASAVPWRMDADTLRFIYVGPRAAELLDYPSEKWMEEGFWQEHIHPEDRANVLKKFMLFRNAENDQEYEYRMIDAHGQVVWIRNIISAPKKKEGSGAVFYGFMFNITKAKKLEDQLRQIQRLEMAERLAIGVANDFNNMLGVIENGVESLWFIYESDLTGRGYLHQIKTAILRAKTLTRQLQAFSSSYSLRVTPVNLNKLMTDLEPLLKMKAPQGIAVKWLKSPRDIWIEGDSNQIGQLFINLFLYAIDSVGERGRISFQLSELHFDEATAQRFAVEARGSYAMITVEDNGRGLDIAPPYLFEPYYTKEGSSRRLGLELAAIYGIVRKHQGFIQHENAPGGGNRFDVFLPLVTDEEPPKMEAIKAPTPEVWIPPENPVVALLVDNEELVRQGLRRILERNGLSVLEGSNGDDALEAAKKYSKRIDLLITDLVMPGMPVKNFCAEITQLQPEMKILIISGLPASNVSNEGISLDIPFLQKPFSSDELMTKISEIMPPRKK